MKNIDFRNGRPLVMMVSQYDYGYNLQIALWTNGEPVRIRSARIVSENFTTICTVSDNVVTIPISASMTERFGHFPAELRVTDSTGQVSSKNFDFFVERSPLAVKSSDTYSGDIVEFTAKRVPLSSVVVTMEPIQDLNGYDAPWPAGGGKNRALLPTESITYRGITFTPNADGTITASGTTTESAWIYTSRPNVPFSELGLSIGDEVTLSVNDGLRIICEFRDASSSLLQLSPTVPTGTIPSGTTLVAFYYYAVSTSSTPVGTEINVIIKPQLERGSTATAWEPYANVCPITGRTGASVVVVGKNLFADKGQGYWRVSDGAFITSGTTAQTYRSCEKIPVIAGAQYTGFVKSTYEQPTNVYVQWWKADGTGREVRITQWPIVAPEDAVLMSFAFRFASTTIASEAVNVIQVEQSDTATEYEANTATTYPITFTSADTVYAGTVDLVSGVLKVTHVSITIDGSMDIRVERALRFYIIKHDCKRLPVYTEANMRCDRLPTVADETQIQFNSAGVTAYKQSASYPGLNWICFSSGNANITTVEQMKEWLNDNPLQVVYPLATPLTYNLTPTQVMSLLGENVVWSEDGEVTVVVPEYY